MAHSIQLDSARCMLTPELSERDRRRQSVKHRILARAKAALDSANVPFWLSCGVLLGYYRQADTIPHDPDVDLGIWAEDKPDNLDAIMCARGFSPCAHKHHNPDCIAYKLDGVKLDLFFHRRRGDKVTLDPAAPPGRVVKGGTRLRSPE